MDVMVVEFLCEHSGCDADGGDVVVGNIMVVVAIELCCEHAECFTIGELAATSPPL